MHGDYFLHDMKKLLELYTNVPPILQELKKTYRHAIAERLLMVSSYTGAGMNTLRKDMLFVCGQNILIREKERPQSTIR